jgi:signal transduction histidine kinase
MLHAFLAANQADLVQRCRHKVAHRPVPKATGAELEYGIPLFLQQLIETLRTEDLRAPSGIAPRARSEISVTAARHGAELFKHGFSVDQVVHDYGDLCQAIADLAAERDEPIETGEFRVLNRCLDNAIADAVSEYSYQHDLMVESTGAQSLNERLGFLAHELRNLIGTATLALSAIKSGNVGVAGATSAVLDRSLIGLRNLIDRSLADVRVSAGMPAHSEPLALASFIEEARIGASLEARARGCEFTVDAVDPKLAIEVDRDLLSSALGNLLQNAFKFTEQHTEVNLKAYAAGDRILIDVEDQCGGLPAGDAETMFLPFTQAGADKTGLGLGLSICRRSVEAIGGVLSVRDVPGAGCVFTISLPRRAPDRTTSP